MEPWQQQQDLRPNYPDPDQEQEWGELNDTLDSSSTEQLSAILQEVTNVDAPKITVIGALNGSKVVKPEWADSKPITLSDRTIAAVQKLGIEVVDEPANYVF